MKYASWVRSCLVDGYFEDQIASIAALNDPVRLKLYRYVAAQGRDVDRAEAAKALGISRSLATFHLEKLTEQGLLETTYRRLTGRTGPGAGRTAKLYRRSARRFTVSLPPRDYEVAARVLAQAIQSDRRGRATARLGNIARGLGDRWASDASGQSPLEVLLTILGDHGYDPYLDSLNEIRLRNCPFDALVPEHEDVICKVLNVGLIEGLIARLGRRQISAAYDPHPALCCVSVQFPRRLSPMQ
jgi:predicted ArsR family transcriptional regulator